MDARVAFAGGGAIACAASIFAFACDTSLDTLDSGSCLTPSDAGVVIEAATDAFVFPAMNPPHAPMQACTPQQLADYAQCQGLKDSDFCAPFKPSGASASCAKCIESQATDSTWGVLVFGSQVASFNIEGCVDLELGQVAMENDAGTGSCGQLLHGSYQCQGQATAQLCSTCLDTPSTLACQQLALANVCNVQDNAVMAPTGLCGALVAPLADGGAPSPAEQCFPDSTLADASTQQEIDWLKRVGAIFCNGSP